MNDYEQICKDLYNAKENGLLTCEGKTIYESAYIAVKKYADGDMMRLLQLKGEVNRDAYFSKIANIFSAIALLLSTIVLVIEFLERFVSENVIVMTWGSNILLAILAVTCFVYGYKLEKYKCVGKMGGHVQVAIEQVEEELRNESKLHKAKSKKKPDKKKGKRH